MKSGVFIVLKKELARFFTDKRLLFTTVIMPGLLIYLVYTVMGYSMGALLNDKTESFKMAAVNMPQSISSVLLQNSFDIENTEASAAESIKSAIRDGDYALLIIFPDDFEQSLAAFDSADTERAVPNVEIYYNSAEINSAQGYSVVMSVLDGYESSISNAFDVNAPSGDENAYDLATDAEAAGSMLSMILPMLLITLLFSSCSAIATESIAGEKERGTIAAMLIAPVPRSQIILGKIIALSVMALLGGLSSFLGTFLSFPTLMSSMSGMEDSGMEISADVYTASDYLCLMLLILSTVLLLITLISLISTASKSVKEAGAMVTPLMIVVMLMSVMSMFRESEDEAFYTNFIPIYNTSQAMSGIFSIKADMTSILTTAAANILLAFIGIFVLTKLFDDERVMFQS